MNNYSRNFIISSDVNNPISVGKVPVKPLSSIYNKKNVRLMKPRTLFWTGIIVV